MHSQLVTSQEVSSLFNANILSPKSHKFCYDGVILADEEISADGSSDGCGGRQDSEIQTEVEVSH